MEKLNWIESAGGPLVIISDNIINLWSGIYNRDLYLIDTLEQADDFTDATQTDHGRACSIDDYLGLIQIKDEDVLILGDEPLPTTIFKSSENEVGVARIYYTDNRESVDNSLLNVDISTIGDWKYNFTTKFHSNNQYLFDAALDGKRLKNQKEQSGFLSTQLSLGQYKVFTTISEPNSKTKLLLHRLIAIN